MANHKYIFRATRGDNKSDVIMEPIELAELDKISRQFSNKKELIDYLINNYKLPSKVNGNWKIGIVWVTKEEIKDCKLTPLYKELYVVEKKEPIFEQILSFANFIGDVFDKNSTEVRGQRKVTNRIGVYHDMKTIKGLRNPEFYIFTRNYFLSNIYPLYQNYYIGITVFDNLCNTLDNNPVNEEIIVNFYNDLLHGFHKLFFNKDNKLQYSNVRKYYNSYYDKFVKPFEKEKQKPVENNILTNIKPQNYTNDIEDLEKIYIDEINESDYFPDEHKNDPRIKTIDGHYEFADDEIKTL